MKDSLAQRFSDADVRIDAMFYLPAINARDGALPDGFESEFLENLPLRTDAPLYKKLPTLAQFADLGESIDLEDLADIVAELPGFIFQACTPVRDYYLDGRGWSCSWGCYRTEWLYASTGRAISTVAFAWARGEHAKMLSTSRAKHGQAAEERSHA